MQVLHNPETGKTLEPRKDGKPITGVAAPWVSLDLVEHERPENYDSETHRIERINDEIDLDDGTLTRGWRLVALTPEEIAARVPEVGGVTKLTLMRRLDDLGKWDTFKALITQLPPIAQDAWNLAQEVKSNDPILVQYGATIQAALQLTDEEYSTLLTP